MTHWLSTAWTIETLIATAILMALVLALRGPVQRAFGARIAYALWLLPALRMVLPPLPGGHMPLVHVLAHKTLGPVTPLPDPVVTTHLAAAPQPEMLAAAPPPPLEAVPFPVEPAPLEGHFSAASARAAHIAPFDWSTVDWTAVIVVVWLVGALAFFAWQMTRYQVFLHRALRDSRLLSRECDIDVLVSPHVSGPVAAGIVRRRILLPSDVLTRYSSAERRLALKHEAAHHDRLDILANLVALTIVALHWWNPLAFRAYRAFRADQELACDATVLADAQAGERLTYGQAMLKSASGRMPVMACALSHKDQLKQRIAMMAKGPMGAWRLLCGSTMAIAAVGGGLLITASGRAAADLPPPAAIAPPPPLAALPAVPPAPVAPAAPAAPKAPARPAHVSRGVVVTKDGRAHVLDPNDPTVREARSAANEGQREAMAAQREAQREVANAQREAMRATAEAQHEGMRAAMEGQREAMRAQAEKVKELSKLKMTMPPMPDVHAMVRASMDKSRAEMAAKCAAQGVNLPATVDFGTLATCGNHLRDTVRVSLHSARNAIERDRSLSSDQRTRALAGIDRAIADTDRELRRD